jgi:hypothetical protein
LQYEAWQIRAAPHDALGVAKDLGPIYTAHALAALLTFEAK